MTLQSDPHTEESHPDPVVTYVPKWVSLTKPSDQPILLIENLILQTAYLKQHEKPISLLLIGKPSIGKSRLLSPLRNGKEVSYVNDITPKYLEFLGKVKNKEKKFLVVPDFTNCMSHGKNTRNTLIAVLRSMTEEGVVDLSDYNLEFKSDKPVRAGLITATTNQSYAEFRKTWKNTRFLSRLLPFSFDHTVTTKTEIMSAIDARQPDPIDKVKFCVKRNPKAVMCPEILFRQLHVYDESLSKSTSSLPYRHQIQLNAITMASAVLRGDMQVTQLDIDRVVWLLNWVNYDFRGL